MRLWAEAVLTIAAFALFGVYVWHMAPSQREVVEPAVAPGEPDVQRRGPVWFEP